MPRPEPDLRSCGGRRRTARRDFTPRNRLGAHRVPVRVKRGPADHVAQGVAIAGFVAIVALVAVVHTLAAFVALAGATLAIGGLAVLSRRH